MFESFFNLVVNRSVKLSAKIIIVTLIVFSLFLVDNIVGYTYYRNIEKKIAQLDKIVELQNKDISSYETIKTLQELELDLNSRVNVLDQFTNLIKSIHKKDYIQRNEQDKEAVPRDNILLFFLSNWIIIFLLVASFHSMINQGNWEEGMTGKKVIINTIGSTLILTALSIIAYYLIGLIPMIGKNWIINYIIAALIQPAIFGFLLFSSSTSIETV